MQQNPNFAVRVSTWAISSALLFGVLMVLILGVAYLRVAWATTTGRAELARAEQNRQIAVLDAGAELERARGVAAANKVVADGLGGQQGYLRYLQIQALRETKGTVIYVPTESGFPVTEATRRREVQP